MFATVAVGLAATGAAANGVGAYYGAKSQKSSLEFQAQMDDINARLAESSAQTIMFQGQREEQRSRLQTAQMKSAQRVALAANGVDLTEGSAAEILTSTDVLGEVDANTIHANAVRAAWGQRTQATNLQIDAMGKRSAARAINPNTAAASTLLSGATQVASSWYTGTKGK
mgnify:FL=1